MFGTLEKKNDFIHTGIIKSLHFIKTVFFYLFYEHFYLLINTFNYCIYSIHR